VTKLLRIESRGFCYKVALYLIDPSAAELRRRRQPETSGAAASRILVGAPAEIYGRRRRRIFLGAPRR